MKKTQLQLDSTIDVEEMNLDDAMQIAEDVAQSIAEDRHVSLRAQSNLSYERVVELLEET